MRGVAALTVVVYHYLLAYGPFTWTGFALGRLTVLGDLPVCVFFVLSGFVLAESAARRQGTLVAAILARYLRLTIPMTASLVLACFWLRGFPASRAAIQASGINEWLSTAFITHQPVSLLHAVRDGVAGVYLSGSSLINCVVWTMKIEFFGSLLIYFLYRFLPAQWRWLGLAGIAAIAIRNPFYLGFACGGALREMRAAGGILPGFWGWIAWLAALAIMALPMGRTPAGFALLSIAAALIVLSTLVQPRLQAVLSSASTQFLGRISFSLYLVHAPLLVTVMAWYQLHASGAPNVKFGLGLSAFSFLSIGLAWLMTCAVDEPLLHVLQRWKRRDAHSISCGGGL